MTTNCNEIWEALADEVGRRKVAGLFVRRVLPEAPADLFLGLEHPHARRLFLLKVPRGVPSPASSLPAPRGIDVRYETLPYDNGTHGSIVLALREERYADVFSALVSDVLDNLAGAGNGGAAMDTLIARLQRWQRFLEENAPEGLGDEAERGLYGELVFLRDHALPAAGAAAVRYWTGSRRTPQDFQFPGGAVEVKTTITRQHQRLTITGERQLDDRACGSLFLFYLSLEVVEGRGETLNHVVGQIRDLVEAEPAAADRFEEALLAAGYIDAHAPRYASHGHVIRASGFFQVRDCFPRIVEADLRAGVGDVKYTISVAECRRYGVGSEEALSVLMRERSHP